MIFFGVGGTNGSGKGSLCSYLAERHNFLYVPLSDLLRNELKRQGLPIERTNLRMVSTRWRTEYGYAVLVERAFELFNTAPVDQYKGLIIDSLRNPYEADKVHELGGKVVWIDADIRLRYRRITERLRSTEDQKTFDQFVEEEMIEMNGNDEAAGLCSAAVKDKADIFVYNETDDLAAFYESIDKVLKLT